MANTLITPSVIAREILDRLYETTIMAQLVHRDFEPDFQGNQGDTITVRRPAVFTVTEFVRATGIVPQDITEGSFTVTLDKIPDVSFAVTAEELTLKIDALSDRYLQPAAEAIAQYVDTKLLATVIAAGVTQTVGVDGTPSTNPTLLVDAGKILNDQKVPKPNRYTVLTTTVGANYSKDTLFHQADKRGDTVGLTEATIGRKFGSDIYESTNTPTAGVLAGDSVMFHKSAVALVTRTLAAPVGLAPSQVSTVNYKGLGLRVVQSYDINKKQDMISVDLLCGFKLLDAARAVRILG